LSLGGVADAELPLGKKSAGKIVSSGGGKGPWVEKPRRAGGNVKKKRYGQDRRKSSIGLKLEYKTEVSFLGDGQYACDRGTTVSTKERLNERSAETMWEERDLWWSASVTSYHVAVGRGRA